MRPNSRRFFSFVLIVFAVIVFYLYSVSIIQHLAEKQVRPDANAELRKSTGKYAYATFLGPPTSKPPSNNSTADPLEDPYFLSVRLLNWQILHSPKTRTLIEPAPPFLVLALPSIPKSQRKVLESEGATIAIIEPLELPDAFDLDYISTSRFRDVLAKLRLWQLTEYDKILYLDADSFLLAPLDDIFTAPGISEPQQTVNWTSPSSDTQIPQPPQTYLMSASTDTYGDQTKWEEPGHPNYLCACFMLFAPSEQLFQYYMHILTGPEAPPNARYPEQDLLIYAHRNNGPMPWTRIPIGWSANDADMVEELEGGVRSLHVKPWAGAEGGNIEKGSMREVWMDLVMAMEIFYGNNQAGE